MSERQERYIDALIEELGLGEAVTVYRSAIEINTHIKLSSGYRNTWADGYSVLWELLNASDEQKQRAWERAAEADE